MPFSKLDEAIRAQIDITSWINDALAAERLVDDYLDRLAQLYVGAEFSPVQIENVRMQLRVVIDLLSLAHGEITAAEQAMVGLR